MAYLYLIYGAAFMGLGLVLLLQSRLPVGVLPHRQLRLLASFGWLHGLHEWLEMAAIIQNRINGGIEEQPWLEALAAFALATSFATLAQFGVEWFVREKRLPPFSAAVPIGALVIWAYVFCAGAPGILHGPAPLPTAEVTARWIFGLPAGLIAAAALYRLAKVSHEPGREDFSRKLYWSAFALAAYAIVGGAMAIPEPLEPVGFPPFGDGAVPVVLTIRAACAIAVGALISLTLVIETSRLTAQVAQQQLHEEFLGVVAHDLRSWLNTISLGAAVLEAGGERQEREGRAVRNIRSATTMMARFVDDMLDANLVQTRQLTLRREPADLPKVVRQIIDQASALTEGHAVKLVTSASPGPLELDAQRLGQILMNLLSNAAKYSAAGADILVEVVEQAEEVTVSVTSYGAGIDASEAPRLFERFYRGARGGPKRGAGLGLGLYIVEGLVTAHGGRVWVESEAEKYATFRFTLPRRAPR